MSRGLVVVAGEALIDLVADAPDRLRAHAGGGPFNAARTVARLEQPVAFLGRLSTDAFGARLREELAADGVRVDLAPATGEPTTLAVAEVAPGGAASYRFYLEGTSAAGLSPAEVEAVRWDGVGSALLGGIALAVEPAGAALEAIPPRLAGEAILLLDPNVRPAVFSDEAAYRARLERLLARTDVLKASEEDVEWLAGAPAVEAARALLERGPRAAIVTRGERGATVVTPGAAGDVPAPPAHVADTIGAGDAFAGALLAFWRRHGLGRAEAPVHDTLLEAARFASAVAARTCERPGASPPRLHELTPDSRKTRPAGGAT